MGSLPELLHQVKSRRLSEALDYGRSLCKMLLGMRSTSKSLVLIPIEHIAEIIHFIRDEKVILDRDLATLYGISTKALKQAVPQSGSLSAGLHVCAEQNGIFRLEVTICDLQN